jgi:hypothetical protein
VINKKIDSFLEDIKKEFGQLPKDLHITRKAMAFVAISNGKIIKSEEPLIKNCPLFEKLFKTKEITQDQVKQKFNWQIEKLGMFSCRRDFSNDKIIVPFGASEILMYAINKQKIECSCSRMRRCRDSNIFKIFTRSSYRSLFKWHFLYKPDKKCIRKNKK